MKKIKLMLLVALGVSIFSGCTLNEAKLVNTERIDREDIESIHIAYTSDTVRVFEGDSNEIVVEEFLSSSSKKAKAQIEKNNNTQLLIENGDRNVWLPFLKQNNHVDIYLPKGFQGNLSLRTNSGSIKLEDDLDLKTLKTEQNSGSLKVNTATAKEMTFKTGSGSIKGGTLEGSFINASSTSGSIKMKNLIGSSDLKTKSGSIKASFVSVEEYVKAESKSGSIKLELPKSLSFDFDGETNSGSLYTDFDMNLSNANDKVHDSVGSGEKKAISVKVSSGNADIMKR